MLSTSRSLLTPRSQKTWCNSGGTKRYSKHEVSRMPLDKVSA